MEEVELRQIMEWRKEIERDPLKRLYHRLAEALLRNGRPRAALDLAEKGLFIHDKKYLACEEIKGAALLALGRYVEAVAVLRHAAQQVDSQEIKHKLALSLFGADRSEDARAVCQELLAKNPFDTETRHLLVKGKQLLPMPITDEEPLAELEETPPEAPRQPQATVKTEPPRETAVEPKTPALATETASEKAEGIPPERTASERDIGGRRKAPYEGFAGHEVTDAKKPFDAQVAQEAEALVDNFFNPLLGNSTAEHAESAAAGEPPHPDQNVAPASEYDPTTGMNQSVDIGEVNVFQELEPGLKPTAVKQGPPPAESAPVEGAPAEPPPVAEAELSRRGLRRLFGGWGKRKEKK